MKRNFSQIVVGGWLLLLGGILLFVSRILIVILPQIPATPNEILAWVELNSWLLAVSDELLCFALLLLLPGIVLLYKATKPMRPISSLIGCCGFMIAVVELVNVTGAAGRLVYPVNGLSITADNAAFAASNLYAGLHFSALMLALTIPMFGFAMRNIRLFIFSLAVGAIQIIGTYYAGITPTWLLMTAASAFLIWILFVGIWMIRYKKRD